MDNKQTQGHEDFWLLRPDWVQYAELITEDNGRITLNITDTSGAKRIYTDTVPDDVYQWLTAHRIYGLRLKGKFRAKWHQNNV